MVTQLTSFANSNCCRHQDTILYQGTSNSFFQILCECTVRRDKFYHQEQRRRWLSRLRRRTMLEVSRDIGPDEVRLNCSPQTNGSTNGEHFGMPTDVEEDTASSLTDHASFGNHHVPGRQPGHMFREVLDTSSNALGEIRQRVSPLTRPQAHNGTDYYKSETNRLHTFTDWRHQRVVRKEDLARNGFIYTGTADKVRCVFCNILLHHWDPSDIVELEHRRTSPRCPLMLGEDVGNVPLHHTPNHHHHHLPAETRCQAGDARTLCGSGAEHQEPSAQSSGIAGAVAGTSGAAERSGSSLPKNPGMAVEPDRLATFRTWPPQMNQKPEQLAQCGFYYTGDGDKVRCFHCDLLLYNWEPGDDPAKEHARWFPDCGYLQLVKGSKFAEDVRSGRPTEDELMDSPAVQVVLFMGHSPQSVQRALAALREKDVEGDQVSAELLLRTIMDFEHPPSSSASHSATETQSEDLQSLQRENDSLREKQQCKICMERDVEVIFFPCRHFVCCAPCGSGVTTCPICREAIRSRDKVFMA